MITPNVWGQGQLFAFSALDGDSFAGNDFVGTLSADRIGIQFHTAIKRELAIVNVGKLKPTFEVVSSDAILINSNNGNMSIIYADTHTIIGKVVEPAKVVIFTEGDFDTEYVNEIQVQNTNDGEFTALYKKDNTFVFAFGKTKEEVISRINNGIHLNIGVVMDNKLDFYKQHSLSEENPYATLYAKFLSVMKSQLYSPEGRFKRIWSTPDRLPHKKLWLWDSVFHAIGHRNINPSLAEGLILDVFDCQDENGFIPHMASPNSVSDIIQPPVIAWGSYKVYSISKNKEFLKTVFEANKKFLSWCRDNRRDTNEELYTWYTQDYVDCRCDESGMDNSPRFDTPSRLQAIDFSCFMANDVRYMAKIAAELNDAESEAYFNEWYSEIKEVINRKLWCEEDEFYYDFDMKNQCLHKVQSVASFLPIFAGICSEQQAKSLVGHLMNPETFYTPFFIPSISKQDATYGSDMWRGPVWINYNYMMVEALEKYGYVDLSKEIRDKTIDVINYWYLKKGTIYEFYDPENLAAPSELNRKGKPYEPYDIRVRVQSIRDYGWSNTLGFDLLHNKYYVK